VKRSIKPPTKAQRELHQRMRDFGCICCWLEGMPGESAELHHINDCGRNMGQNYVLPLCAYHHRGVLRGYARGPSLADGKKPFVAHYGTELELLERVKAEFACDEMTGIAQAQGEY